MPCDGSIGFSASAFALTATDDCRSFLRERGFMGLLFGLLLVLAAIGGLIYTLVIHREVPGLVEQRFGVLDPLPADVGRWKPDIDSEEAKAAARQGLQREVRLFHHPGGGRLLGGGRLVRQARYRNPATNAIARVDPDVPVRRRRLKS